MRHPRYRAGRLWYHSAPHSTLSVYKCQDARCELWKGARDHKAQTGGCRYLLVLGSSLMSPFTSSQFPAEGQWGLSKDQQGGTMSSCREPQWWGSWSSQHTEILYLLPLLSTWSRAGPGGHTPAPTALEDQSELGTFTTTGQSCRARLRMQTLCGPGAPTL